jgi:hypothetical protein
MERLELLGKVLWGHRVCRPAMVRGRSVLWVEFLAGYMTARRIWIPDGASEANRAKHHFVLAYALA